MGLEQEEYSWVTRAIDLLTDGTSFLIIGGFYICTYVFVQGSLPYDEAEQLRRNVAKGVGPRIYGVRNRLLDLPALSDGPWRVETEGQKHDCLHVR